MSARLLYQAAELAGFDPAGGWPPELEYPQLVALLTANAPGPWPAMLADAVSAGRLEARKAGRLSYWFHPGSIHTAAQNVRDLTPEEIATLEAERDKVGRPSGVVDWKGRPEVFEHSRFERCRLMVSHFDGAETGRPPIPVWVNIDAPMQSERSDAAAIRWHFARPAVSAWLHSIGETPGPLMAAWIGKKVGAGGTAKDETPEERRARLTKRANELKASGVRAWQQRIATEEGGISTTRVRKILKSPKEKGKFPALAAFKKK